MANKCQFFVDFIDKLDEVISGADTSYSNENWVTVCHIIFAAAHGNMNVLVGDMPARAFALDYKLPERTVQRWLQNDRSAPDYVVSLLGFAIVSTVPKIHE